MIQLLIALASLAGAQVTFYLIHKKRLSPVRASSAATLAFALATVLLHYPFITSLQAAFFGATFVGMTSNSRMGRKRLCLAALLFAAIFTCILPSLRGLGGGLGSAAFVASSMVYFVEKALRRLRSMGSRS